VLNDAFTAAVVALKTCACWRNSAERGSYPREGLDGDGLGGTAP
jgi:hypothetical protein